MDDLVEERLQRLDVCAVSDAMDSLGLKGWVGGLMQQASNRRIAGRVVTYRLVRASEVPASRSHEAQPLGIRAIEIAQPGEIIVIEQRTGIDAGSWGGILSLGAKLRHVAGVIADGPVRDIDEARGYDLPIYCRSLTALKGRGRLVEDETNGEVTIGDVKVNPGDYVIADASGVVFVAAADIDRLLAEAEAIVERETHMAQAMIEGTPIGQAMSADYEDLVR